ncbi:type 2 lanthipeptide synthetase LanM family protein [Gracilibacillus xinjiangensis]|uniref:Type 2 lanthipeptide synthetase LanM family protein n=1 Tax=Gracilibacillus xinjiangensis TaxID=1193282 RepID=A0ABV8WU56_9BACI
MNKVLQNNETLINHILKEGFNMEPIDIPETSGDMVYHYVAELVGLSKRRNAIDFNKERKGKPESFDKIYDTLTLLGMKVFQSNISCEDKIVIEEIYDFEQYLANIYFILYKKIRKFMQSSLVYEMNILREAGSLGDQDPHGQYQFFEDYFFPYYWEKFLVNYPLLVRNIVNTYLFTFNNTCLLLKRLKKDFNRLKESGLITHNQAKVAKLELAGDSHNKGNHVTIIHMNNDEKIVYKLGNSEILTIYNQILRVIQENAQFKVMRALQREGYLWIEYIESKSCSKQEEVKMYYQNIGKVLFVVYLLNGNDIHNENIIAHRTSPVIVDFETITSQFVEKDSEFLSRHLSQSVLRTRMLPIKYGRNNEGIRDFSAIGRKLKVEIKNRTLQNPFTSVMREVTTSCVKEDINTHLPEWMGERIDFENYRGEIIKGFETAYKSASNYKETLKDIVNNAPTFTTRTIFRSTRVYTEILKKVNTPSLLRNEQETKTYLRKLLRLNKQLRLDSLIIDQEIDQLLNNDIPYFVTEFQTGRLMIEKRKSNLEFPVPKDQVINKMNRLSISDKIFQINLVEISLNPQQEKIQFEFPDKKVEKITVHTILSLDKYKKMKLDLLSTIGKSMYVNREHSQEINFLGLKQDWQGNYRYDVLNKGIYDGTLGVLLYLNTYDEIEKHGIDLVMRNNLALQSIQVINSEDRKIGLVNGTSAVLQFLVLNKRLFHSERTKIKKDIFYYYQNILTENRYYDKNLDLLEGTTGLIVSLFSYYHSFKDPAIIPLIDQLGKYLLNNKEKMMGTEGIANPIGEKLDLFESKRGLVHGYSGYLIAFYCCYKITNNREYYNAFCYMEQLEEEVLKYERSLSWCKGWTGIGVARLTLLKLGLNHEKTYTQLEQIKTKLINGIDQFKDYSLCHGFIGALDLLFIMDEKGFLTKKEKEKVQSYLFTFIKQFHINHYNPNKISLFTGLSGIGYFLNRIESKEPSVICFGL